MRTQHSDKFKEDVFNDLGLISEIIKNQKANAEREQHRKILDREFSALALKISEFFVPGDYCTRIDYSGTRIHFYTNDNSNRFLFSIYFAFNCENFLYFTICDDKKFSFSSVDIFEAMSAVFSK